MFYHGSFFLLECHHSEDLMVPITVHETEQESMMSLKTLLIKLGWSLKTLLIKLAPSLFFKGDKPEALPLPLHGGLGQASRH